MAFVEGLPEHFFIREDDGSLNTDVCPCTAHRDSDKTTQEVLESLGHQLVGSPEFDQWFRVLLKVFEDEAYQRGYEAGHDAGWEAAEDAEAQERAWGIPVDDYCSRCDD